MTTKKKRIIIRLHGGKDTKYVLEMWTYHRNKYRNSEYALLDLLRMRYPYHSQ